MRSAKHRTINPSGLRKLWKRTVKLFSPPPRLTVSEWADEYAYIPSGGGNAEPGKFRCSRLPYQKAMLDDFCDPDVSEVAWMIASQICKTASIVIGCMYYIHQQPCGILVVYPNIGDAETFSKEKLTPSIKETPCMAGLIKDHRQRDSDNTTLNKRYPGGTITMCGANSPSGLRQRSKRIVVQDEIDGYENNKEGDPLVQADTRAETFHNAIKIKASTPTIKGDSRIEKIYENSDKQMFFVPCGKCGEYQTLRWSQVKWKFIDEDGKEYQNPKAAYYECEKCGCHWTDAERIEAISKGEWRATAPFTGIRGRHMNGIYRVMGKHKSFTSYLHQFVENFLKAKRKGRAGIMAWTNTFLAETFEEDLDKVQPSSLMRRREAYANPPNGVLVLTVGADVQADRIELEVVGWGENEESWGIQYVTIPGRYDDPRTWQQVDELLNEKWEREDGLVLPISAAVIDSGAFQDHVLKFTKPRYGRRVFAGKGVNAAGHPVLSSVSRNNKQRAPQYRIGTDTAKGIIVGRLKQEESGPGFMHFTAEPSAGYDEKFFDMLTSETFKSIWRQGALRREWVVIPGRRNEALDCRVYSLAALYHLNPNWSKLKKNLASKVEKSQLVTQQEGESVVSQVSEEPQKPAVEIPKASQPIRRMGIGSRMLGGMMRFQTY